jgi:hypothetical protein
MAPFVDFTCFTPAPERFLVKSINSGTLGMLLLFLVLFL